MIPIPPDERLRRTLSALRWGSLEDAELEPGEQVYRALYEPSFHPIVAVELRLRGGQGWVRAAATPIQAPAEPVAAEVEAPPAAIAAWREELGGVDPLDLMDAPVMCAIDGMGTKSEVRCGERFARFKAHSPRLGTPWNRYLGAMRRLGMRVISERSINADLRVLGGYLGLGGLEDLGGSPRWLRLDGWPREREIPTLLTEMAELDPQEPWLLDLRDADPLLRVACPASFELIAAIAAHPGPLTTLLPPDRRALPYLAPLLERSGLALL